MKQRVRHLLSVLLVCAMVLSLLPISVLAEELETPLTTVTEPAELPEPEVEGEPEGEPAPQPEPEPDPAPAQTIYVSVSGNDTSGDGTEQNPYASLAKAVENAQNGDTIELLSNVTLKNLVFINEKSITIDGQGYTVYRADDFVPGGDLGRGGYHPAMIEVANGAELTLLDITLDDGFKTEGTEFLEQLTGKDKNNENKVQDAIIAAYKDGGTIILGKDTVLKNFGGMSAVRIGGPGQGGEGTSTLIMQPGSKIIDDMETPRRGGVAAVWSQGGKIEMQDGSEICDIDGRAIYLEDGGIADIDGDIHDITSNEVMTDEPEKGGNKGKGATGDGFAGIALALYVNSHATLKEHGDIYNIASHDNNVVDVVLFGTWPSTFTMERYSTITGTKDKPLSIMDSNGMNVYIDGTISNFNTKYDATGKTLSKQNVLIRTRNNDFTFEIQEHGVIENCSSGDAALMYFQGGKIALNFNGTLRHLETRYSTTPVAFIAHTAGTNATCTFTGTMEDITGSGLYISKDTSRLIVDKGTIQGCSGYAIKVERVENRTRPVVVIKEESLIENNNGGKAQIIVTTTNSNNEYEHVDIASGTIHGNKTIEFLKKGSFLIPSSLI